MKRTRNNTRAQQNRNDRKTKEKKAEAASLERLRETLDSQTGRYAELNGARDFAAYLERKTPREDEEILTEPILAQLIERLLGFPQDGYFPQLGRSGLKPDFTPIDLIAHRFVLDAKSSTQDLVLSFLQFMGPGFPLDDRGFLCHWHDRSSNVSN